jgi:hypothetical protein
MMSREKHNASPTIFHATHWKSGSQWVSSVLKYAAPRRVIQPAAGIDELLGGPIKQGCIYTPVYASYTRFRALVPEDPADRTFFVIRDPRDALVSWYFSLRYSHEPEWPTVLESREELRGLSKAEGLALMIGKHMRELSLIQQEWIVAGVTIFRYEDLVADEQKSFKQIFDFCRLRTPNLHRRLIVLRHNFRAQTWRRSRRENPSSHLRKGIVGDWKNHFDDRLKDLYKAHHGATLVQAGYEKDDCW